MTIEKNGKAYSVKENRKSWTVSIGEDRIVISANISKEIYQKKYVKVLKI